jgi:hypothetical protein
MSHDLYRHDIFHQEEPNSEPAAAVPRREADGIIEVGVLAPGAYMVYSFEMRRGDPLYFGAHSNRRISIALTTYSQFDRWTRAASSYQELKSLQRNDGRLPKRICFQAGRKGCYQVVVINLSNQRAKVIVEAKCLT